MQISGMKTIRVSDEMHEALAKLGNYGESMDDIIRRLVTAYHNYTGHTRK
jgi:predicted CopG family antitoxin